MAALRSDPAAAFLLVPDAAADAPQYMVAISARVQAALSGERQRQTYCHRCDVDTMVNLPTDTCSHNDSDLLLRRELKSSTVMQTVGHCGYDVLLLAALACHLWSASSTATPLHDRQRRRGRGRASAAHGGDRRPVRLPASEPDRVRPMRPAFCRSAAKRSGARLTSHLPCDERAPSHHGTGPTGCCRCLPL